MSSYLNIFSGNLVSPSQVPYASFVLNSNLTLSWSTSYGSNPNPSIIAYFNNVTAAANGCSLILPDATQVGTGLMFYVNNSGNYNFNIVANDGAAIISTIKSPSLNLFVLASNSTSNGTWLQAPLTGSTAVTSVSVTTAGTNGNLTSSGSPIINSGTISIGLGADLLGIANLGTETGLAVRQTVSGTWGTTAIEGTPGQLSVVNGNGIGGNPILSLPNAISGIGSISLNAGGNLSIGVTANTIASTNLNGNISIIPNGIGNIYLGNDFGTTYTETISLLLVEFQNSAATFLIEMYAPGDLASSYSIQLPLTAGTTGQVLSIESVSGSTLVTHFTSPGSGTVTAITAGSNLTGGTITSTGTIALSNTPSGLTSLGVENIISNPTQNLENTGLTIGNAYQNALGYDITMCVILEITVNSSGTISMGVDSTNTPLEQIIFSGTTTTGFVPLTFKLPAGYYVIISVSDLTAEIRGQYAVPN
jgi:hypothetical protein